MADTLRAGDSIAEARRKTNAALGVVPLGATRPARIKFATPRVGTFDSNGSTRLQWLAAFEFGGDDQVSRIGVYIDPEAGSPTTAELVLMKQVVASTAQISSVALYEPIHTIVVPAPTSARVVYFDLPTKLMVRAGDRYIARYYLRNAAGTIIASGTARSVHTPDSGNEFAWAKGAYSTGTGLGSWSSVSTGTKIWCEVLADGAPKPATRTRPALGRHTDDYWGSSFTRVVFTELLDRDMELAQLAPNLRNISTSAVYFKCRLIFRPGSAGAYSGSTWVAGQDAADRHVMSFETAVADVADLRYPTELQKVLFTLPRTASAPAGTLVMLEVTPLASDRATVVTMDAEKITGYTALRNNDLERGGYSITNPPTTVAAPSAGNAFGMTLYEAVTDWTDVPLDDLRFATPMPAAVASRIIPLPDLIVRSADRDQFIKGQSVTLDALATTSTINQNGVALTYNTWRTFSGARWWSSVTMTKVSDGTPLTEGVDFEVQKGSGRYRGLINTAEFNVNITINAQAARVDHVCMRVWDRTYVVQKGTESYMAPEVWAKTEAEFTQAGLVKVLTVLLKPGNTCEVMDKTRVERTWPRLKSDTYGELRRHNARVMSPVIAALMRGDPVTNIGYGDSITAGHGGNSVDSDQVTPGGVSRDLASSYVQQPADAFDRIGAPKIDGPAGDLLHTEASYHHRARRYAQTAFGATIGYQNLGIGGTDSSSTGAGTLASRYNGTAPARLAALVAAKQAGVNYCTIAFGTNDPDDENLLANTAIIVDTCMDNGIIPVVIGQPITADSRSWQRLERNDMRLMRAAMSMGAAFVPLASVERRNPEVFDAFPSLRSASAGTNHPGLFMHMQYGKWVFDMLFGFGR